MIETLTLEEVAKDLRVSSRTVRRLAKSGDLPVITKPFKGGFYYTVPVSSYLEWKSKHANEKKEDNLLSDSSSLNMLQEEWLDWCKKGLLTGKPLSERTIEIYEYYLNQYWKLLPRRYTKSTLISLDSLREVFSSIDIKSYSTKKNIYDALRSFIKFLTSKGYANQGLLDDIQKLRPKRFYPPKKVHCTQEQFEVLLSEAGKRYSGQSDYDVILNSATIATIGFAGLRASELCNLRLQDVDLVNRKLFVYLGKGKKNRSVGICNKLYEYLTQYLNVKLKTDLENFFVTTNQFSNTPVTLTRKTLAQKIERLSKRTSIPVSPHALRRTMATIAANSGKPINIISLALGHADLKTTQGYLMTSQDEVIKEMQGW
jgi:integrase/recombinase XerD